MTVNATYTSTFLPVVFTMAIAIPLYKWLEKRVSKLVKSFMVPAIALAVAVPLIFFSRTCGKHGRQCSECRSYGDF